MLVPRSRQRCRRQWSPLLVRLGLGTRLSVILSLFDEDELRSVLRSGFRLDLFFRFCD